MIKSLRKYHKPIGVICITPLLLQTLTGILLSFVKENPARKYLMFFHTDVLPGYPYLLTILFVLLCLTGYAMMPVRKKSKS